METGGQPTCRLIHSHLRKTENMWHITFLSSFDCIYILHVYPIHSYNHAIAINNQNKWKNLFYQKHRCDYMSFHLINCTLLCYQHKQGQYYFVFTQCFNKHVTGHYIKSIRHFIWKTLSKVYTVVIVGRDWKFFWLALHSGISALQLLS